jgi:hypothetical protein
MDKKKVVGFLKFLGIKLNAEDLAEINGDETPVEPVTETVAETTPEVPDEALVANAFPPQAQAPQAAQAPLAVAPAPQPPVAQPSNMPMLDALINEMGGFEAFKAVMLKCLEMGQAGGAQTPQAPQQQPYPNSKRTELTTVLLASSKGAFTQADLDGMSEPVLLKLSAALKPEQASVDFGALGLSTNAAKKQTPAPRPSILLRETAQ